MKGAGVSTGALVGVGVSAALLVGLVWWGHSRAKERAASSEATPGLEPAKFGRFPDLKVGDLVEVDTKAASLPSPFNTVPSIPARVDMVLTDPLVISVEIGVREVPGSFFSGTVPRSSLLRVLTVPGLLQV